METIISVLDEKKSLLEQTADFLWDHPETAFTEFQSAACLCDVLRQEGFTVEENLAGIATAFSGTIQTVWAKQEANIIRFVDEFNAISTTPVTEINWKNNHTIAYLIVEGFGDLSIKVNDHDEMGFFFTLEFSDGTASLEKYEKLMADIVKVFDANVEIGNKFQEANANPKTNVYLSDNIFVEYHYIKDAIGYQPADTYIITLTSTDYNK